MRPHAKSRKKLDNAALDAMVDFYNMGKGYSSINYELRMLGYAVQTQQVAEFLKSRGLLPRPNLGPQGDVYK